MIIDIDHHAIHPYGANAAEVRTICVHQGVAILGTEGAGAIGRPTPLVVGVIVAVAGVGVDGSDRAETSQPGALRIARM